MKRNHEIRIKLNEEEHEKIKTKSDKLGMTVSGLLRYLGLNSTISVVLEE